MCVMCYVIITVCVCIVLCHCHCLYICAVCRYGLDDEVLELIEPEELWPSMRYGHSAVVYEVTCVCTCVCTCVRMHVCMYVCMRNCVRVCVLYMFHDIIHRI